MIEVFRSLPTSKHLALLGRYNLSRAMATNMTILGLVNVPVQGDCSFTRGDIELFPDMPTAIPQNLQMTRLQGKQEHEAWIDLFPCPQLRDSLIRLLDTHSTCEFMYDAAGRLEHECSNGEAPQAPGVFIWSDPWMPHGWEFTPSFIEKWALLLVGCEDLIRSTNYWRSLRGEAPVSESMP
jgi:hypothetical protein